MRTKQATKVKHCLATLALLNLCFSLVGGFCAFMKYLLLLYFSIKCMA